MSAVTCCACGRTVRDVGIAIEQEWYPCVFHDNEALGDLCPECAHRIGLRSARKGEVFDNDRIVSFDIFVAIKEGSK